jgi:hypothetical protein
MELATITNFNLRFGKPAKPGFRLGDWFYSNQASNMGCYVHMLSRRRQYALPVQ